MVKMTFWMWKFQILILRTLENSAIRYRCSSIPLYEYFICMLRLKNNNRPGMLKWYQPLRRIGLGLALASASMAAAAAAIVEYLLLGISDMLTLGGMLEFFYSEAPDSMRSMSMALSWCSTSMGYFISSVLVTVCNSVSEHFGKEWLGGRDLNLTRLDLFLND
ncbi:hypothetical protein F3Y22_tig00111099pilonHSYRG00155 [Hibiscus syriacus]|uniref:Uncharacterized protein n=1 Tax=Hibiscus syriacus TaxID=106335 RepID=A0A6A2Z0J6_HIBSY|nr:hypothetical protein F3Y22_tig00111099pilonHSYRG00155 [Hibiscus syriacus]